MIIINNENDFANTFENFEEIDLLKNDCNAWICNYVQL